MFPESPKRKKNSRHNWARAERRKAVHGVVENGNFTVGEEVTITYNNDKGHSITRQDAYGGMKRHLVGDGIINVIIVGSLFINVRTVTEGPSRPEKTESAVPGGWLGKFGKERQ